jgi:hypothetical protein
MSAVGSRVEQEFAPILTEQERWSSSFGTNTTPGVDQHASGWPRTNLQCARLMLLRNFIAQIGKAKFNDVLQTTLMELCPIIHSAAAYIFIADSDGRLQLQALAARKDAADVDEEGLPVAKTTFAQRVFESERAWIDESTCGVLIRSGQDIHGVLAVLRSDRTFFNADDLDFLKQFAT